MISPFTTFIYFSILTTVYFVLKFMLTEKHDSKNKSLGIALGICYLIIMILLQISSNMANAKEKCGGTPQTIAAINYTIIPNLFIFGALLMVMMFFPGWKAPFSNTIGYLCVMGAGIKETFTNILKTDSNNKLLKMVYRDPSMMINEMTPENFGIFINKMGSPPNSILSANYKKFIPELYNFVVIKDKIAEFLWYMFTGYLVIQNSNSYINTIKCKRSPDELEAKLTNMMDNPKKKEKKQKWKLGY
jgi:hypothetical protein|tara:strand:+ start:231 stop:968 length:738 start_codon:yes stop_codon:yes gene_type:complete